MWNWMTITMRLCWLTSWVQWSVRSVTLSVHHAFRPYSSRTLIPPLEELEVKKGNPNRQLIEDYHDWFREHR